MKRFDKLFFSVYCYELCFVFLIRNCCLICKLLSRQSGIFPQDKQILRLVLFISLLSNMIWSTWFGQFTFDRLLTLIYPLYHYAQYIEQHQLYFGQSTLKANLKVPRSIWHTTRAASLHLFYLVLFGLNLAWNAGLDKPVLFLDRSYHFPKPIRDQILIGCSVACIMSLLVAIFGLSTRLSDYRFTAVLLVKSHRDSCAIITEHNLGLKIC